MSTPRKRHAEADNTSQARKRSRLLDSSTAGTSEEQPIDLEESHTLSFELAGEESVDLTAESPESDNTNVTADGSAVQQEQNQQEQNQQEQNQQDPAVSREADNSVVPPANDEEQEPRNNDDTWLLASLPSPSWIDEQQEQNQQDPLVSRAAVNSGGLLASDEEELSDNDGPVGTLSDVLYEDCFLWQQGQNQQDPAVSRAADNSAGLLASGDEEEPGTNNDAWLLASLHSPSWIDEYSQLLEAYEEDNNQRLLDSSLLSSDAEDEEEAIHVYLTDSAAEEEESSEEETESSNAGAGVAIRCPICMDYYSEIVKTERLVLSTLCGHIFCSQCLPVALETASFCPTCRKELSPEQYHPIYI